MKTWLNCIRTVLLNIPYVLIAVFGTKIGQLFRYAKEVQAGRNAAGLPHSPLRALFGGGVQAFADWQPSFLPTDILVGLCCGILFWFVIYLRKKYAKKYRHGVEHGSARWGGQKDIEPFMDKDPFKNTILTQTEGLRMGRPPVPMYDRTKNTLIIGGSGSGKTRFWLKPNLMQCHSSYVVTDPKGTILIECGRLLRAKGYRIKILNTINFKKSMHYNPFSYIRSEKDILSFVTTLIANTKNKDKQGGDEFWEKSEVLLYCALIGYMYYELPPDEHNFNTLLTLLDKCEVREDDEEFENEVDVLFRELAEESPNHFAVRQYTKYKMAAGKTAKSILISCGARLAPFDIEEVRQVTEYDELELDKVGDRKTAMFFIISDTDATFNFLVALAYTQMFNLLCTKADDQYGGKLPVHVRCLIDEFANIGQIPNFDKLIATIRSREISACLVLQAQSQLKAIYKDNADTITGNCDSVLFLGGKEKSTLKEISEALGKETIDSYNTSDTRGSSPSYGTNYQKLGKELMTVDELAVMDGSKCILQLRGVRPFISRKYDITQHPYYKYTSDYDKRYAFDIEKYINRQPYFVPKPDMVCQSYYFPANILAQAAEAAKK